MNQGLAASAIIKPVQALSHWGQKGKKNARLGISQTGLLL